MRDLIFLLVFAAFFAIAVGVLRLCERIIGPEDAATDAAETAPVAELVDAA